MIDKIIHNYKITKLIGEGGMASVFEAENLKIGTKAAIKVLNPVLTTNEDIRKRFENEAKMLASLDHPNIVKVIDYEEQPEFLAIIMDLLHGESLSSYVRKEKALILKDALRIMLPILNAFSYAHKRGIVHRDVKPSNIFFNNGMPIVLDFGIAKIVQSDGNLTSTGMQIGTPTYMSPEQVHDAKNITLKSDIYSLGVTFFFMLNGAAPYDSGTTSTFQIYKKIDSEPLPILDSVPKGINDIIQKATAKKQEDRYANCEEFKKAILSIGIDSENENTLIEEQIVEPILKKKKKTRKGLIVISSIAAIFIAMIISLGYYYFFTLPEKSFTEAKEANTIHSYSDYLEKYPKQKHVNEAKDSIGSLTYYNKVIGCVENDYAEPFIVTNDSTSLVFSTFKSDSLGCWISILDKNGFVNWEKKFPKNIATAGGFIWSNMLNVTSIDTSNFILVSYVTKPEMELKILKLSKTGNIIWEKSIKEDIKSFDSNKFQSSLDGSDSTFALFRSGTVKINNSTYGKLTMFNSAGKQIWEHNEGNHSKSNYIINLENDIIWVADYPKNKEYKNPRSSELIEKFDVCCINYEGIVKWDTAVFTDVGLYVKKLNKKTIAIESLKEPFLFIINNEGNVLFDKKISSLKDATYESISDIIQVDSLRYIAYINSMIDFDATNRLVLFNKNGEVKKELFMGKSFFANCTFKVHREKIYCLTIKENYNSDNEWVDNNDIRLLEIDDNLSIKQEYFYGGKAPEDSRDFFVSEKNEFIILSSTESYGSGKNDIWLFKTDNKGQILDKQK